MKNCIRVNDLFQTIGIEEKVERVLWIDEKNVYCYTIDIYSCRALPKYRSVEDIIEELETDSIVKLTYEPLVRDIIEEELTDKEREIREKAWKIARFIANESNEPDVFIPYKRRQWIKEAKDKFGVGDKAIYMYLKRYWQGGKNKNALVPRYYQSGAPGRERNCSEKKRGRPNFLSHIDENKEGINIDDDIKRIFRVSIKRFYNNEKENSLSTVYEEMIKEFFSITYETSGKVEKIPLPKEERPTLGQLKYWFNKERNYENEYKKRKGKNRYNLDSRPLLGSSTLEALGPGSRYQIDATIADVYLVSRYNRNWIIGRPIVYAILDVFSRMVTGLHVGLEGPSWIGAMMAIVNMAENKVSYCKKYGIDIEEKDWPCQGLPISLLADRGELEGKAPSGLINYLDVDLENTPPYRGDLKPIVEQYFRTTNIRVKRWSPGFVKKEYRERGDRDYRLDAKLDIYQFSKMMIELALHHNSAKWLDYYQLEETMIKDGVNPIPINLWKWGIENRSGKLKNVSDDVVKLNLMPRANATILRTGIRFKGMYYSCDLALKENWYTEAEIKGSWKVNICYDPRNTDYIYIPKDNGKSFEKCYMLEKNQRYLDKTIEEIEYLLFEEKIAKDINEQDILRKDIDVGTKLKAIENEAVKMTNEYSNIESKSKKLKGISINRKHEKEKIREEEAWELGKERKHTDSKVIKFSEPSDNQIENMDENDALAILKKVMEELKNEG